MTDKKPSILVVDDDRDTCANLKDILGDSGYNVDVAYDGVIALDLIRKREYEVALLDLKMPGMDGVALYRRIKQLRPATVAIIVSAYASGETASAALSAGAWQVLPKPVDFDRLFALLDKALDQPLVLVVDDDFELCQSLWDLLRERGFRVCLAHDPEGAAQRISSRDWRVVLIDMKLPQGSGADVFRSVRAANPGARTIMITGFRDEQEEAVKQVLREGADAVCYKPFDVDQLLNTLAELSVRS